MWNTLAVILWAVTFRRNVTEDSVNDRGDIGLNKWGVVRFLCIIFTLWIATRISCMHTMTLCMRCTGAGISLLCGSPGGSGRLFSGMACGTSAYTTRRLLATRWPGGKWRRVNSHVPLSDPFPRWWHIACLFPNKITAVLTGLIHLTYFQLKAHVKCCACVNFCRCSLMYWINATLWLFNRFYISLV